ncbi:unnamed protein product [Enterobius vermicularis]|uniref:Uncharacterized protein n=1 Tax=Enterobius vermicularis TaxID=51028 RepID=A0A0N4VAL0_ENTVE|nr:unnamed protein product [Enterobius vermicularis]
MLILLIVLLVAKTIASINNFATSVNDQAAREYLAKYGYLEKQTNHGVKSLEKLEEYEEKEKLRDGLKNNIIFRVMQQLE